MHSCRYYVHGAGASLGVGATLVLAVIHGMAHKEAVIPDPKYVACPNQDIRTFQLVAVVRYGKVARRENRSRSEVSPVGRMEWSCRRDCLVR